MVRTSQKGTERFRMSQKWTVLARSGRKYAEIARTDQKCPEATELARIVCNCGLISISVPRLAVRNVSEYFDFYV